MHGSGRAISALQCMPAFDSCWERACGRLSVHMRQRLRLRHRQRLSVHVWQGRRRRRQRRRARAALTRELGHPWPSVGLIDVQLRRLTPWEAEARWLEGGSSVPQRPSCLHSLTTAFCVTWRREGPAGFQRSAGAALARRPKRLQLPQTHPPLHGFWSARRAFCGSCTNVASWRGAPAAAACS